MRLNTLTAMVLMVLCVACQAQTTAGSPVKQTKALTLDAALTELAALPITDLPPGVGHTLKAELARQLKARGVSKFPAAPPTDATARPQLTFDNAAATLSWAYYNTGDYNQDSLVSINDLTPIGQFWQKALGSCQDTAAACVDGNCDRLITINDITPIGQNFQNTVAAYNVYASADMNDYPATPTAGNGNATLLASLDFASAIGNEKQRKRFTYTVPGPQPGDWYWVRPTDGTSEGTASNIMGGAYLGYLELTLSPISDWWPDRGAGTVADPYVLNTIAFHALKLTHSIDGDVTADSNAFITSSQPPEILPEIVPPYCYLIMTDPMPVQFSVSGTYLNQTSPPLYFTYEAPANSYLLEIAGDTPPLSGAGTQADPWIVDAFQQYGLIVVDTSVTPNADLTSQAVFTPSDPAIQLNAAGYFDLAGANPPANFSVTAQYQGGATSPGIRYFSLGQAPSNLTLAMAAAPNDGGSGTQQDPYRVKSNARYFLQVDHLVDGLVTDQATFTPAYINAFGEMMLAQGTTDFTLTADYNAQTSNALYFQVIGHNQPPVASFTLTPDTGDVPLDVLCDATASTDPDGVLNSFDWSRDGMWLDGDTATRELLFTQAGDYNVELTVIDEYGITGSDTQTVHATATAPKQWHPIKLSDRGLFSCSLSYWQDAGNPLPAVALSETSYLEFYYASDVQGTTWTPVLTIEPDSMIMGFSGADLRNIGSMQPALSYTAVDYNVVPSVGYAFFVSADAPNGSTWHLPQAVALDPFIGTSALLPAAGALLVFYVDQSYNLILGISTDGGSVWIVQTLDGSNVWPDQIATGFVGSRPAVAYYKNDSIIFRVADNDAGDLWTAPPSVAYTSASGTITGLDFTLGAVPMLCFVDQHNGIPPAAPLFFLRAADAQGSAWEQPVQLTDPGWAIPRHQALAIIDGKPAIAYYDGTLDGLFYRRADDSLGRYWSWAGAALWAGDVRNPSMLELNGMPCVAFNTTLDNGATSTGTFFTTYY